MSNTVLSGVATVLPLKDDGHFCSCLPVGVAVLPCAGCSLDTVNSRLGALSNHLTEFAIHGVLAGGPHDS
ncbi:MAG: hypothetical protein Q7O66_09980, partial [Dehalococcoidia bacterium]|nr:hypothetical protein [Dehalococcoidia bacterium]